MKPAQAHAAFAMSDDKRNLRTLFDAVAENAFDYGVERSAIKASIHSQYPVQDDYDKGYRQGRIDVANDIRSLKGNFETPIYPSSSKFEKTYCSNCGKEFGPGDHGFSHCEGHSHLTPALRR